MSFGALTKATERSFAHLCEVLYPALMEAPGTEVCDIVKDAGIMVKCRPS